MRKVVLLGYGTVGKCVLPLLMKASLARPELIKVIDREPPGPAFAPFAQLGTRYITREITRENLATVLRAAADSGDLLINLSVSINCLDLADWCQAAGVMYIDTAFEPWGDNIFGEAQQPAERTMYWEHHRARQHAATLWHRNGPTALFGHGANPGLVSHFAKAAIVELANEIKGRGEFAVPENKTQWGLLAASLGVRVIHVSERDTQIISAPKQPGEFVNTWSIYSFIEESCRPVEIGWGTHERVRPAGSVEHTVGRRNSLYVPVPSSEFLLRSWVPRGGPIEGIALPHSESITISDFFTLDDGERSTYRPTVVFCYLPSDSALASIHEVRMSNWTLPTSHRIVADEIISGADELGVLVLGPEKTGWWYGSHLDIRQTREILSGTNPTALQVAAGVVSASKWILENPNRGYLESEDLPYQTVLDIARPYLGTVISTPTSWDPLQGRRPLFDEPLIHLDSRWQFNNFIANRGFRGR